MEIVVLVIMQRMQLMELEMYGQMVMLVYTICRLHLEHRKILQLALTTYRYQMEPQTILRLAKWGALCILLGLMGSTLELTLFPRLLVLVLGLFQYLHGIREQQVLTIWGCVESTLVVSWIHT